MGSNSSMRLLRADHIRADMYERATPLRAPEPGTSGVGAFKRPGPSPGVVLCFTFLFSTSMRCVLNRPTHSWLYWC